jgi:hypothetical protein
MTMDGIAEGEHTVAVTATFRGQVYTYTGWVTVSETGASTSAFNLSASCTYDEAKSTVTCRATPANPPANASLEYIWFWGGGIDASKTDTMTVSVPSYYRTYEVQVRCLDRTSSTYSAIASTSVVAGRPPVIPPALGQAINNALTGSPTPSKPDPAAVAGGAAAVGLGLGLVGLVNGLVNSAQQAATDAVKGIRSLPGVKAVEAAAKDVYIRNVAYAAAAGNKDAQALVGDQIQQVASDLGIPLPASLTGGETSATANKPVANPPPGGGAGQPESGSTGDKAPAQEPGWKAELEESGATYVPIFSEILESAAAEGNLKPAAPKSKDVTPLSPKEPKVTPDKIMDDVIKASEYDKAQERVKDLMAQWMENFSLPYEDRTIGPLERDNLRAEREKLEHQIQEEIKKRDDLLNPKKDKPE